MNLYHELIMEHFHSPSNFGALQSCTHSFTDSNPLCGDEIAVQVLVEADVIKDIAFTCRGCAISKASTSMLTEFVKGRPVNEVKSLSGQDVFKLISIELSVSRVKCALLGLITLKKALYGLSDVEN